MTTTLPQRRQSNAAYVPRNAGRAFQNTTTTRVETTKEAKRKTLPAQGAAWATDTPQSPGDGFSCAQLAYAHKQLQAYSDELRANKSPRVLDLEDDATGNEVLTADSEALPKVLRRAEDRPDWTQTSDDDGEYQAVNGFKAGAARMLHLSKVGEREYASVTQSSKDGENVVHDHTRHTFANRQSHQSGVPYKSPSLRQLHEKDQEDIMNYVKNLPRKQPERAAEILLRSSKSQGDAMHTALDAAKRAKRLSGGPEQPTFRPEKRKSWLFESPLRSSRSQGDSMQAAVDASKRARASSGVSEQYAPMPQKRTSRLFDNNVGPEAGSPPPKSSDAATLDALTGTNNSPSIRRTASSDAQTLAREREEIVLHRRTLQADFSPPTIGKRTSWLSFSRRFNDSDLRSASPVPRAKTVVSPDQSHFTLPSEISHASSIPRPRTTVLEGQSDFTVPANFASPSGFDLPWEASRTSPILRSKTTEPIDHIDHDFFELPSAVPYADPILRARTTDPTRQSRLATPPPKTMLVAQAAKRLHEEELERRKHELSEARRYEQDMERKRNSRWLDGTTEGPASPKVNTKAAGPSAPGTGKVVPQAGGDFRPTKEMGELPKKEKKVSSIRKWFNKHFK